MGKPGYKEKQFYLTELPTLLRKEKCLQNFMFAIFALTPAAATLLISHLGQIKIIQTINAGRGGRPVAPAMDGQSFPSKRCCVSTNPARHKRRLHRNLAYANQW
jgi:hypothetical protein